MQVTILGSNSAIPAYDRHPSAQLVIVDNQHLLLDCGEGTQMRLKDFRLKMAKIEHIFISHLHGDHYLGLVGLLDSLQLGGRLKPLAIYGPPQIEEVVRFHHRITGGGTTYPIHFIPFDGETSVLLLDTPTFSVRSLPLNHGRIFCHGFLIAEKPKPRKMIKEQIGAYNIPYTAIKSIKAGDDWLTEEGEVIANALLTLDPPPAYSYAYCCDTAYHEALLPLIKGVDLLYHESTYLEELKHMAKERGHATAKEAASIAAKAEVGHLLLGHFSSRYKDLSPFITEAQTVFSKVGIAIEGETFYLKAIK